MLTTTHPLSQTEAAFALAEAHEATLVLDNPTHTNFISEIARPTAPQQATWYVASAHQPALATALADMGHPNLTWTPVDETLDYVAATAHLFPDLTIGPFTITRSVSSLPSTLASSLTLYIPPNQAFGSGEHSTTTGCLLAFEHLYYQPSTNNYQRPTHALDFGAGSAILALAAAKLLNIPVVCADNEAPAVRIALENATTNGVVPLITSFHADTPAHPDVMARAPYPLIFANILLGPLLTLATPLMTALAEGGYLILSGFRTDQEADILTAYSALTPIHRHVHDNWVTLTLRK